MFQYGIHGDPIGHNRRGTIRQNATQGPARETKRQLGCYGFGYKTSSSKQMGSCSVRTYGTLMVELVASKLLRSNFARRYRRLQLTLVLPRAVVPGTSVVATMVQDSGTEVTPETAPATTGPVTCICTTASATTVPATTALATYFHVGGGRFDAWCGCGRHHTIR